MTRAHAWLGGLGLLGVLAFLGAAPLAERRRADITVNEGTSMSVAASPDGRALAIDLQGTIWVVPSGGGRARRITDPFNDARQPTWSPDGGSIAFQGYRDGTYDIWTIAIDGTGQRTLTSDPYDDREPAWSHDGSRIAFSSDRSGNYDIWVLELRTGNLRRITDNPANDYMPSWSPGDTALAFISARGGEQTVWTVSLGSRVERQISADGTRTDAPSWGPGGRIIHHVTGPGQTSRLALDGVSLTGDENAFPFRAAWISPTEFVYTADGKIRRRSTTPGTSARTIAFSATLTVNPARYTRRVRDVASRTPRRALGIVRPEIAPDGRAVAFAAVGDLWMMPIGGRPQNLTNDRFLDTDPAWSPDGTRLVWSTDRGGGPLNLWIHDLRTGEARQLTTRSTSAMGAAWSPDGRRIAFLDVDGQWRRASIWVIDVATGAVAQIQDPMFGPGTPTWSPDGRRVVVAALSPYSTRFREGTNQALSIAATPGDGGQRWLSVMGQRSIDSRVGAGPAWSPDGSKLAVVSEGVLWIVPVSTTGEPTGQARRVTTELAHAPTWTADSRSILYQSMDRLRLLDVGSGSTRDVPVDLSYAPHVPAGRLLVHAGAVVDGKTTTARPDIDIVIEGNRIRGVEPHRADRHVGIDVVDGSGLTAIPGLIEFHSHLQKDFGEAHGRAWLAFGITTVRSPGNTPYEAVEDREAVDAAVRVGPRVYGTGYLMEWQRAYYKMSVAVASDAHLAMELERARVLEHDFVKSYVRMPDLQQRRMIEFAHGIGIPAASHEIYPAAMLGIDGVEHTTGTSRRGYSPKSGTLGRSYADVAAVIGGAGMTFTPTLALGATWLRRMVDADTALRTDPRFELLVPWLRSQVTGGGGRGRGAAGGGAAAGDAGAGATGGRGGRAGAAVAGASGAGELILAARRAGARIVAGTDTPNPANLHAELMAYVAAGMTPYDALRSATLTPAEALRLDAGSIEPGKLADIVLVEGNPLQDIGHARRVRVVIANGRALSLATLLRGQ